jgi:hypothetical protein
MNDDIPYHLLVVIFVALMFLLMAVQDTIFPLGNVEIEDNSAVASTHNEIQYLSFHPIPSQS